MRPRPARLLISALIGVSLLSGPIAGADTTQPSVARIEELVTSGAGAKVSVFAGQIWNTPLGILMHDYLYSAEGPSRVAQRARQITNRVYASVQLTGARLTALQILFSDLYERGVVDLSVQLRIDQLQTEIAMKGHVIEHSSTGHVVQLLPLFIMLGALGGSHLVREQTAAAVETAAIRLGLERNLEPAHRLRVFDPGFIDSLRAEFGAKYSYVRAGKIAVGSGLTVAATDYFFQIGADDDSRPEEQIINYFREVHAGLEDL